MSIKIFVPNELFYIKESCNIYGEIKISENNSVSCFIIAGLPTLATPPSNDAYSEKARICNHLRHLGHIQAANQTQQLPSDVALTFAYDADTPNIYLQQLSIRTADKQNVNIFLFEPSKLLQLHMLKNASDDISMLYNLLQDSKRHRSKYTPLQKTPEQLFLKAINLPLEIMTRLFCILMESALSRLLLQFTIFYEHYEEWKRFRATNKRCLNITVDRIFGIFSMLLLLFFIPQPEIYVIQAANFLIAKLRLLLVSLDGNPIGLKLNTHLNTFLLDCFKYHIDLWELFLDIIKPCIHQLFLPIAILGSMGLSYQLALLADIIFVICLHAHCFYTYTAVMYKIEIQGLQVLWRVVRGKRYNVLKNRVESHNYTNRQLYLATIFFATLLFLFPTVLVFYAVFTTVRLVTFLEQYFLKFVRRQILEFPLSTLLNWLSGRFFKIEGMQLQLIKHTASPLLQPNQLTMSVFNLSVRSSSLSQVFSCESGVLQQLSGNEDNIFKIILKSILVGKF